MSTFAKPDPAAGQRHLTDQGLQEGSFAHAVVTEHADHFVLADREVDPGQNRNAAVAGVDIADLEHHAATCLPR